MPTTEHTINDVLADLLRETRSAWRHTGVVPSENTGMLKGSARQPDILVLEQSVSPVAIETELLPAATVEADAMSRIGVQLRATGKVILSAVAVRLPVRLREKQGKALRSEMANTDDIEMALYSGTDPSTCIRWPQSGWNTGRISDLSVLVQAASVPPHVIDKAADELVSGVSEVAGLLGEMVTAYEGAIHKVSEELRQEDGEQTRRMAATILADAFIFLESLAGGPGKLANVASLEQLRGRGRLSKSGLLAEWRKILKINYWPIFDIARRILELIPTAESKALIESLAMTADRLVQGQLMHSHDLTGAVFQRLIADRKFLAAYYTTPASAALLVGLAVSPSAPPSGGSWSSADDVKNLRIGDFACGTGTLLSTAYQRISQLHELGGGDAEALHPQMMATALVGCDVLPAAAHLTAAMLSGAHPTTKYDQSSVFTVAYGKQSNGPVALGSLDLLDRQGKLGVLAITAKAATGKGEKEKDTWRTLPHSSFDLAIMNPPFTRDVGHEGKKIGVPNPMFAAFRASEADQRLMAKATDRLIEGTSAHGNAGEASIFLVLADRMLKRDGVLAMVMPLSLMSGEAWERTRAHLYKRYSDLMLVSIAGTGGSGIAFSADTGMGDCLVIGKKVDKGGKRATFVILNQPPSYPLLGTSIAEQIRRLKAAKKVRTLEEGPVGGTRLHFGDEVIGHVLDAPIDVSGGWGLARIADLSLAQAAYQMANNKKLWLPSMNKKDTIAVPITTVSAIGKIGPYHADINGDTATGGIRGPFEVSPVKPGSVPTFPVLWSHEALRERTMSFDSDREGTPKQGRTSQEQASVAQKVTDVWKTASHCHFNRDFRFNSQSTAMQFTPRKTIGGRAWSSIQLASDAQEKALVLWANTSLGLLLYWWHANRQQDGRGSIGILALETLPVLNITALNKKQLAEAAKLFDVMKKKDLLPFNEIGSDATRKELDEKFVRKVLGLNGLILDAGGPFDLLRMKLSKEPSICGQKQP